MPYHNRVIANRTRNPDRSATDRMARSLLASLPFGDYLLCSMRGRLRLPYNLILWRSIFLGDTLSLVALAVSQDARAHGAYGGAALAKKMMQMNDIFSQEPVVERRKIKRSLINRSVLLSHSGRAAPMPCVVRDATNCGASLRIPGVILIPTSFRISLDNFVTSRTCQLVWRDGDFLGVRWNA